MSQRRVSTRPIRDKNEWEEHALCDLRLGEFPEPRLALEARAVPDRDDALLGRGGRDDANLDRLLVHDALEPFLERQERRVDRVLEREVVVVPAWRSRCVSDWACEPIHSPVKGGRASAKMVSGRRRTSSRGTSLRWSGSCRSRSPSTPRTSPRGRPGTACGLVRCRTRRRGARRRMAGHHCARGERESVSERSRRRRHGSTSESRCTAMFAGEAGLTRTESRPA